MIGHGVDVVYRLDRIALEIASKMHEQGLLHVSGSADADDGLSMNGPSALVMVQGKTARQAHNAVNEAGIASVMPLTGDWRLDSNPRFAYATVELGSKPTRKLFTNARAVLKAAEDAQVQCILLGTDSLALAEDNRFLQRAADAGLRVFKTLDIDTTFENWVECEPSNDEEVPRPTKWRTCHACKLTFDNAEFAENGHACPSCDTLARLTSDERIELIVDEGTFEEWDADIEDVNPLEFPGYAEKIASYRERTGKHEAVRTGKGMLGDLPVAFGFMESEFLMGSMGSVVGEKVSRLFDRATEEGLPVIIFCASGGARMQEGLASLMQMAKTACAVERHDRAGLQRVIRDTIKQDLPEGFQTAEFALEHGLIDAIVEREDLRDVLKAGVAFHRPWRGNDHNALFGEFKSDSLADDDAAKTSGVARKWIGDQIDRLPFVDSIKKGAEAGMDMVNQRFRGKRDDTETELSADAEPGSAWESVQIARNVHRPTASSYIKVLSPSFLELHGDREFADDKAIVAGLGRINGRPVTIIAQEKGSTLNERIKRNFGCPQPEGYRKTARLMRQAEKFNRPIVCLVDTQGAFCGTEAEERGQGNAIAENLELMAGLRVPVVSVLLGEGGSGGALALALANRVAMQQHAVYSVLSPEGFASILWKDGSRASEAAEIMGMSAGDAFELGVVDAVLPEGEGAAHENPEQAADVVFAYVNETLEELSTLTPDELLAQRQSRFARF